DGAIHGANGPAKTHPSRLSDLQWARTGRAESRARPKAKAKRQPVAAFFACWGQIPLLRKGL
ncbi:hypothetical protein, partial [Stenotrophomonas maltophilia]|uniref:hypothetical protein n=1 Tax=Stenotrophomonas maltophilia TaxID=40324 RepID=UPI00195371D5